MKNNKIDAYTLALANSAMRQKVAATDAVVAGHTSQLAEMANPDTFNFASPAKRMSAVDNLTVVDTCIAGNTDIDAFSNAAPLTTGQRRYGGVALTKDGKIRAIKIKATAAGAVNIVIGKMASPNMTVIHSFALTLVQGLNTYVNGVDFTSDFWALTGYFVGIEGTSSGASVYYQSSAETSYNVGTNNQYEQTTYGISITAFVASTAIDIINNNGLDTVRDDLLPKSYKKELLSLVGTDEKTYGVDPSTYTSYVGASSDLRLNVDPTTEEGVLKDISIKVSGTGVLVISLATIVAGALTQYGTISVPILTTGYNVLVNGVDFDCPYVILAGTYFCVPANVVRVAYKTATIESHSLAPLPASWNAQPSLSYAIGLGTTILTKSKKNPSDARIGAITHTDYICVDSDTTVAHVTLTAKASKLHMIRNCDSVTVASRVDFVDFDANTMGVYNACADTDTASLTVKEQKTVGFTFVEGHQYVIESIRTDGDTATIKITDAFTMETDSLTVAGSYAGGWGYRTYAVASGSVAVNRFDILMTQPTECKVLIAGDSFVEGNSIVDNKADRYAKLIKTDLSGDAFIAGMGGLTSTGLLPWFAGYLGKCVRPKYVIIAIGTNDTVYATWLSNVQRIISIVQGWGSIPILVTVTRSLSPDNATTMASINTWIRASGYKYIDANIITTVNYDGVTQDTTLFFGDKVHPTIAAHLLIYKRAKLDLPELFV